MSALTSGRNTPELSEGGRLVILKVSAGAKIYDGSIVALDATGYAQAAEKAVGLTVVGRAEEYVDNTSGGDGDATVKVRRGTYVWENSATALDKVATEDMFKTCYIEDDCTVTSVAEGSSAAGKVIAVYDDGSVAVEMGMA